VTVGIGDTSSVSAVLNPARETTEAVKKEVLLPLKRVRLELGRTKEYPEGSPNHGYELTIYLQEDGHIDLKAWEAEPQICTMVRFWGHEDDLRGQLIRTSDGGWAFSYAPGEEDDERLYRLVEHVLREGDYVSVTEHDGTIRPFKVVTVGDWHPGS